jgi:response regulator of citrate/malate metabolism
LEELQFVPNRGQWHPDVRFAAIGAGANEMLFKPIPREHLHRAIAEYLGELSVGVENAGTHSQAASDRLSQDDIDTFVDTLTELAQKLQELLDGSKADEIRAKVLELSTTAQQYGFGTVAFQAGEVMKLLDSSGGLQRAAADVRRLIRICEKAHAPTRRAPAE